MDIQLGAGMPVRFIVFTRNIRFISGHASLRFEIDSFFEKCAIFGELKFLPGKRF